MFNFDNTEWKDGATNLILGQQSGLIDSLNRRHPKLFSIYKGQKSDDWQEDDVNLEQTRTDFLSCPEDIYGRMIDNLAYQWELDSVAVNSMYTLLAPFISDSDFKMSVLKNTEIEALHALTYAEIVRLATPKPEEVFKKVHEGEHIQSRGMTILKALEGLKDSGMKYTLGELENNQELYNKAFLGLATFYCLERCSFMSSFAHTFDVVEQGWFQGAGKLVQKIMKDEFYYHCRTMEYALKHEMTTTRGSVAYMEVREDLEKMVLEVAQREFDWNSHMSEKYQLNIKPFDEWVKWNTQEIMDTLYIQQPWVRVEENPLPYMDDWLDLDMFQNAQQEGDGNNYALNSFVNDIPETKIYERW